MKKLSLLLVLSLLCLIALVGCGHMHAYTPGNPSVATCTEASVVRYTCTCGHYYDTEVDSALGHSMTKTEGVAATCTEDGVPTYYTCSRCEGHFADEAGATALSADALIIPAGHQMIHHPSKEPLRFENGNWEYWECSLCEGIFFNAAGTWEVTLADTVILSSFSLLDFVVEVEEGRDPIVLQLTDPQFINTTEMEERAFSYMRETIEATKPDLILLTGDLVYGKYDPTGEQFSALIDFMDSFRIPWAPVFGNHENESAMGVDWQCAQLEASEYCLFKRGDVTGNGNYTVGVASGERLTRVFYMLDSNGCAAPSEASRGKVKISAGFAEDQIAWYTEHLAALRELEPNIKVSFAFHIQLAAFSEAMQGYGTTYPIYLEEKGEGMLGLIGVEVKAEWDKNNIVWNGLKDLGVDSIFVGHDHCQSGSLVYEGVRLQFGQKSSSYDRHNWILDGRLGNSWNSTTNNWDPPAGAVSLVGGTVIPLAEDGTILKGYIYLCGELPENNG